MTPEDPVAPLEILPPLVEDTHPIGGGLLHPGGLGEQWMRGPVHEAPPTVCILQTVSDMQALGLTPLKGRGRHG